MIQPSVSSAKDARVGQARASWRDFTAWMEQRCCVPGEDEETRQTKVHFTFACILVVPAGLIWGALYFAYGERVAAAIPSAYSILTFFDLVLLRPENFTWFRRVQQAMILVLPFALQLVLGGFVGSGAVIVWSFVTVVMAVLFASTREAVWWFIAYACAIALAGWLQPRLAVGNHLPSWLVLVFFVLNVITVSSAVFVVLLSFVTDRRRLRQLEVDYLNQEMALRQSEKLAALGTLVAGVAHELNNPAAAVRRAADQLRDAFARLEEAHVRLASANLTAAGREQLGTLDRQARERSAGPPSLDPLGRSDQETAVEEWLDGHGVRDPWDVAPSLVAQGFDPQALTRLGGEFEDETLSVVLTWVASAFSVYTLLREIGQGSARLSEIVSGIKGYSYLGQAPVQTVDLHEGLNDTLVMLRDKLTDGISVRRDYGADVPRIQAYGSMLNQVWTNLLVNAIDAMGGTGEITIRTRRQERWVVVEIEDDGPGIPEQIQHRIFDPFFTTKEPGKGTGLGLALSHRTITQQHKGEIRVESQPGRTRFIVKLPIELPSATAPPAGGAATG